MEAIYPPQANGLHVGLAYGIPNSQEVRYDLKNTPSWPNAINGVPDFLILSESDLYFSKATGKKFAVRG